MESPFGLVRCFVSPRSRGRRNENRLPELGESECLELKAKLRHLFLLSGVDTKLFFSQKTVEGLSTCPPKSVKEIHYEITIFQTQHLMPTTRPAHDEPCGKARTGQACTSVFFSTALGLVEKRHMLGRLKQRKGC